MPQQSTIEWTDATWNPVTGCSKVSQGCKNCYAEAFFARPYPGRKFTDVRCHPERLDWPLRWRGSPKAKAEGRPSHIFVNSMSDLFHEDVPDSFIAAVLLVAAASPNMQFQILTKRPARMKAVMREFNEDLMEILERHSHASFSILPPKLLELARLSETILRPRCPLANVQLIVSCEDQPTADERVRILLETPAAVRGVSYEPALRPVDFSPYLTPRDCVADDGTPDMERIECLDWIIAGGESGPHARPPHPDWFRSVRDQCAAAGVPFFFKQWGAWKPLGDFDRIEDWNQCYKRALVLPDGTFRANPGPDEPDPEFGLTCADLDGNDGAAAMGMCGKKKSGRLLDGREHNAFPEAGSVKVEG